MIPNENCYCEIDPEKKDKWGVPVLRFHWKWSDYEINQALHAEKTFAELIEAMGGIPGKRAEKPIDAIEQGGSVKHEVGGALMGDDPKNSVCNQWAQTWEVKNLFLHDGAPFASNADKNPTLTIMALAWRNSEHILEELQKGNI
jgi:choline dehydrogenase-like flavoprotein